jgi:hypothetical protein
LRGVWPYRVAYVCLDSFEVNRVRGLSVNNDIRWSCCGL